MRLFLSQPIRYLGDVPGKLASYEVAEVKLICPFSIARCIWRVFSVDCLNFSTNDVSTLAIAGQMVGRMYIGQGSRTLQRL
jgi:hypothetical protein